MTRGPHLLDADIRALGGIASAAELLDLGYTRDALRLWGDGRLSRRLRRGWYGLPDLPEEVVAAWVAGGSLACISALEMAALRGRPGDAESPAAAPPLLAWTGQRCTSACRRPRRAYPEPPRCTAEQCRSSCTGARSTSTPAPAHP